MEVEAVEVEVKVSFERETLGEESRVWKEADLL